MSRGGGTGPFGAGTYDPARQPGIRIAGLTFTKRELLDLVAAWIALSVAFAALLFGPRFVFTDFALTFVAVSAASSGVGFMIHELAHKVVAIRYGQVAHFRADYGMLFVALMSGFAGFLFAAPGAVVHRGRITERENGLIALAGPMTNLALLGAFVPLSVLAGGILGLVGAVGVYVNALLAGFNLIPFGPLDGRSVLRWNKLVWAACFVPSVGLAVAILFGFPGVGELGVGL
jgi:Zn-dependent protease